MIPNIEDSKYHNIIISDHSPVTLNLKLSLPKENYGCCFNPLLLSYPTFKYISNQISVFLETNDNGEVNETSLWKALKVSIRGQIISYEAREIKLRRGRLKKTEEELKVADQTYKSTSLQSDYNHILKLEHEYNSILAEQVGKISLKLKQKDKTLNLVKNVISCWQES